MAWPCLPDERFGDVAHRVDRLVGREPEVTMAVLPASGLVRCRAAPRWRPGSPSGSAMRLRRIRRNSAISPDLGAMKRMPSLRSVFDIAACGGVGPHRRVHGGDHQHRLVGGEQYGAGEVVGQAWASFAIRSAVAGATQTRSQSRASLMWADILLVLAREQVGVDMIMGERADGERRHELLRGPRSITGRADAPRSRSRRIRSRDL